MTRILICGAREWNDFNKIKQILNKYTINDIIIHGDCVGADKIGGYLAKQLKMEVLVYPADWKKYGRSAGPIRNQQMIDEGKPDYCYAFHSNIEKSKGTKDMIFRCIKACIPYEIIS